MSIVILGANTAVYRGAYFDTEPHSHFAVQVCLAQRQLKIELPSTLTLKPGAQAVLIPANTTHQLLPGDGDLVVIYFQPILPIVRKFLGAPSIIDLDQYITPQERSAFFAPGNCSIADFEALIKPVLERMENRFAPVEDEHRIGISLNRIAQQPDLPLGELAAEFEISVSRLRHLFKEILGISIRDYRMWLKIQQAILTAGAGHKLSWSALEAGFYDQPQFNRVFKKIFGVRPTDFFQRADIRVLFDS